MNIYGAYFINTSQEVIFTDHQNYHKSSNLSPQQRPGIHFQTISSSSRTDDGVDNTAVSFSMAQLKTSKTSPQITHPATSKWCDLNERDLQLYDNAIFAFVLTTAFQDYLHF